MADLVLIVDDDTAVLKTLYKVIRSSGLDAETTESGEEALRMLKEKDYALLLLDINMPRMDGFEIIELLRKRGSKIPIIVVSARKNEYDTLYGLDIGADDFVTKPFNPVTLGAKAKALIRRSRGTLTEEDNILTVGPFTYNTSTLRFYKNSVEISLSGKENSMMKLFLDNPNRVLSRDVLYDMIWNETVTDDNTIMVYINRLRQKIEDTPESPQFIQTVRGIGYRFVV